ncbi:DDE superfamily endonuclease [Popillia japonica]|uniref:DDE superfamily endonuclease n=1 Tax=Popillia japonica TaxID=7064 RepID=A0AAW1HFE9_POPJA
MNVITSSSSSSDDEEVVVVRRRKVYRNRVDCFNKYNESEFFERFRLTKETVRTLLDRVQHLIAPHTNRGGSIPAMIQLLLTLRFYATGSMLISAGDFVGVSKASACRVVKKVSTAICTLLPEYINMPRNNVEIGNITRKFYEIARFPRVIGAIDCTLIKIQSPGGNDAEIFRCRKGFFALNVQTVSDPDLKIRNIVVRWPGSCHDQTIFNNSNLKQDFLAGRYGRYLLLGDSGYRTEPYLMTPLLNTQTAAENLYNESLIRSRNVVERQYGVWKRRFPILSMGIRLHLETAMDVIVATAVLHNIAVEMNENIPDDWVHNNNHGHDNDIIEHNENEGGHGARRLLIAEHFANL